MVDQQGMSARMCMQSFVALQALGIFRELILRTRTTTVAFWDPPSGSKKKNKNAQRTQNSKLNMKKQAIRPLTCIRTYDRA